MREQAQLAIEEADVIIFLTDGAEGLTQSDKEMTELLRKSSKNIILAVNKIDDKKHEQRILEFHELGFKDIVPVSAEHNIGIGNLMDTLSNYLPQFKVEELPADIIKVAVIGRPNVGKSSLVNRLLGKKRLLVSEVLGTTRDSIDTVLEVDSKNLLDAIVELIRRTSSDLPVDVVKAIKEGLLTEKRNSIAHKTLQMILKNIDIAREKSLPICQDTGTPVFYVKLPYGVSQNGIRNKINRAIKESVHNLYLRPNIVDTLTGKNLGDKTGTGYPVINFEEWKKDYIKVILMLKGGGCENVGTQYALPDSRVNAGRDLEGVRRCILDAVHKAQGRGCAPGIIGVCIGGDRVSSYEESKRQLLRRLDDRNENPVLGKLEQSIMRDANKLGIGPMGFGGRTTLLGVKIGSLCRIPPSYFVSVTYMCWAYRRRGFEYENEKVKRWLY